MTAHPESVVGRLRAADMTFARVRDCGGDIDERRRALLIMRDAAVDAHPALLAALEKVWPIVEPYTSHYSGCCDGAEARDDDLTEIRTILAPLFESPEKTT